MPRLATTPDGRRIEVYERIAAPRDRVWELFRDTEAWPEWGPSVRAVEAPTRYVEAGTSGRVRTVAGIWLPFEVRTCADYRWTWDVGKLPATGHRIERGSDSSDDCVAVIEIPPLAAPYTVVCERGLRRLRRLAES